MSHEKSLSINDSKGARFYVGTTGKVGIATDQELAAVKLNVDGQAVATGVGIGTNALTAAVDFHNAGRGLPSPFNGRSYMYPPKIPTSERNSLTGLQNGAMIYNTTNDQLQIYINGWVGIGTTTLAS